MSTESAGDMILKAGLMDLKFPDAVEIETAFVLFKARDRNGSSSWGWMSPGITNQEELLGALTVQVEQLKADILESWE